MNLFERIFQSFMSRGGFAQPCIDEDVDREYRQLERHMPTRCPHGKTALTCDICYFYDGGFRS